MYLFFHLTMFGQTLNQPIYYNTICDDAGTDFGTFNLIELSNEIYPFSFTVVLTHHLTLLDAENGINPLESPYTNMSNPQTLYARAFDTETNTFEILAYNLSIVPNPVATPLAVTACADFGDTYATFDLNEISQSIWNQNQTDASQESITFFETLNDADNDVNGFTEEYMTYMSPQIIYYKVQNTQASCSNVASLTLISEVCQNPNCAAPTNLVMTNITNNTATLNFQDNGNATEWAIGISPSGGGFASYVITSTSFVITGLNCNENYSISVRAFCGTNGSSIWSNPATFTTGACTPDDLVENLSACFTNGQTCFDLTQNTANVLQNLNAFQYSVTYHTSANGANTNTELIQNPANYCISTSGQEIYVRINEIANPANFQTTSFSINVISWIVDTTNPVAVLEACDHDMSEFVTFNLTSAASNMNNPMAVNYYLSETDALNEVNSIPNPQEYITGVQPLLTFVFAKADYDLPNCSTIYKIHLKAFLICNNAYLCNEANSLCGSLNQPFINSFQGIQGEEGIDYACLNSTPNPTWFYLKVSSPGNLQFQIQQSSNINFTTNDLDVDFVCYGPFTSPTQGCQPNLFNAVVDCSFSGSTIETINIPNAQVGQYFLIMTTNFSGQAGYIKITEQPVENQGSINCSGIQLNAFLDVNSNSIKDLNEVNFPLGTFSYELNNNGTEFYATSPFGQYFIYDEVELNSYDVSFSVLPEYASNYNVTIPSYQNLTIATGSGIQVYNFPVTSVANYMDVAAYIVPLEAPRPGFTYKNKIVYANLGNQNIGLGTLTFTMDENVTISNISQTGTVPTTSGFTFDYNNLQPFEVRTIDVTMQVPTIPTVELGQLLTNIVNISPIFGDVALSNNTNTNTQTIIGSYDPNDKMESRGGQILHSAFGEDDYLFYTIRFENTGTASAVMVRIEDLLDEKLDENSLRMIHASHDYVLERNDNKLIWYFDDIQLPPTIQDPILSQGYVYFKIKPKPEFEIGDIIPNTAEIYFDFNPAIVTNTFETAFVSLLDVETFDASNVAVYPNPAANQITISLSNTTETIASIRILDVLGKQIMSFQNMEVSSKTLEVSNLLNGIYFIEIETKNNKITKQKLIIKK